MITLSKNAINDVVLTLSEKSKLNNPYYIFSFTNDTSGKTKTFATLDISTAKSRYNRFLIEESATEDLHAGKITLDLYGSYSYDIYEGGPSDANNLIVTGLNKVESGKVVLRESTTVSTYTTGDAKNYVVYE